MDPTKSESERHKEFLYAKHKAFLEDERVLKSFERNKEITKILKITLSVLINKDAAISKDQRFFKQLDESITNIKAVYQKLQHPDIYTLSDSDEESTPIEEKCSASVKRSIQMSEEIQRKSAALKLTPLTVAPQQQQQQIQQPALPFQMDPMMTSLAPSLYMMLEVGRYMMASAGLSNHSPLPPLPLPPLVPPYSVHQEQPVTNAYSLQSFNIGAPQPQLHFGHNGHNSNNSQPIAQQRRETYGDHRQRMAEQDRQRKAQLEQERKNREAEKLKQLSEKNRAQFKSQKQSELDTPQPAKRKSAIVDSMVSRPPPEKQCAQTPIANRPKPLPSILKKPNAQPKPKKRVSFLNPPPEEESATGSDDAAQDPSSRSPVRKKKITLSEYRTSAISNGCNLVISNVTSNLRIKKTGQNSEDLNNNPISHVPMLVKEEPIELSPSPLQAEDAYHVVFAIQQEPNMSAVKEEPEVSIYERDTNATTGDVFDCDTTAKEISSQELMKNSENSAASIQEQEPRSRQTQIEDVPSLMDVNELEDNHLEIIPLLPPAKIRKPNLKIKKECCI